jgi:hypothetical protein
LMFNGIIVQVITVERITVDLSVGIFAWWEIWTEPRLCRRRWRTSRLRPSKKFSIERRMLKKIGTHDRGNSRIVRRYR